MRPPKTASHAESLLRPGVVVGRYVLDRTLARGSFGTVWSAEDLSTESHVAIKFLHPFLCESNEAIARLKREADAISAITHPNVVEVFEFARLPDGRPYIVMELLAGTNLYTRLRRAGAMTPEGTLNVLEGICAALTATHALGIIHRDIKASNAFLVGEVDSERTVLLDYGLAKILESDGPDLTSSRATLGTPSAMSPEQIRSQPVTVRTDVYALGALAYHLLTGDPAFYCASRPTILYMHLHSSRPRPSHRADVSPLFDEVVAHAMAREPGDRYPSAMAFLADFASAVRADSREGKSSPPGQSESDQAEPVVSAQMLGVYVDVNAPADELDDPSDELLDDLEAIASIAEPILGAAGFESCARRGNSTLFAKVCPKDKEYAERRRLLRLLAVIRAAIESRPDRMEQVIVRMAVDAVAGGVGDSAAERALLEAVTETATEAAPTGMTLGTPRFFEGLGIETAVVEGIPTLRFISDNSEL